LSSSSPDSKAPSSSSSSPQSVPSSNTTTSIPYVESRPPEPAFNYAFANTNGNPLAGMVRNTESTIERVFWSFHILLFFYTLKLYSLKYILSSYKYISFPF
jgi:hypothetical protein